MAYNDFMKFATNHRNLLETAIKKYPTALKPSDLIEFDQVIFESRKELRSRGLLENWKPLSYLKSPEDFLHMRENNLIIEAISSDITGDTKINQATRSQIDAINNLRQWFDALPPNFKEEVDSFAQHFSPSENKFEPELDAIEEKINSMYGKGSQGGILTKLAKNFGGWLTRGMSKLTGAGRVADISLEEQVAIKKMVAESRYINETPENLMFSELFGQRIVNEVAPGISFPGYPNFQAAFDAGRVIAPHAHHVHHAHHTLGAGKILAGQIAAGQGAVATSSPAATLTAIKTGAAGKGAAAAVMAVPAGLMVGGALLAAGAVYAGWSARDTRKRIESLLKIARFMKKKGVTPLNVALNSNPEIIIPNAAAHDSIAPTDSDSDATLSHVDSAESPAVIDIADNDSKNHNVIGHSDATESGDRGDIYIFKGKKGAGFQSRAASLLNKLSLPPTEYKAAQKDASAVLRAMAKDLKAAGFNVLEEDAAGLQLPNTREALARLSPDVKNIFTVLLNDLAREHGFEIKASLENGNNTMHPAEETPLNREQKLTIKKYMHNLAGDPDYDTVESIKKYVQSASPPTEEGRKAFKDTGLMESYSFLRCNNLISDRQYLSRKLRLNKCLIRESITN